MGSKKRKMLIGGVVAVGVIGAAAGSFLLVNKARKTYRAKQEMLKAQKELKDWANNAKLSDKKYYTSIANDVNSLNDEVDKQVKINNLKSDENYLATAKKVKSKTKELKNELVETDQINEKTLQEIQVFDEKLNQFIDKYKLIAPKKITYFKNEQNKLNKQYEESSNKENLKATKARAEELIKLLKQSIVLADKIIVSKELLDRLPDTFELKNKLGNEITKAKEVLENPASTQEKINRAKEELARIYDEVNNAWSNTSDGIQQNIKNNIDKANEYHNKELKDPKYDKIAEDLAKKIKEIEDKAKNTTDVDELKGLEKEANQALEDAKKTKELIDKLSLEVQKAEKIKEEINKNPDLYDQDLKNNLDKAIDEAKKALDQIDNNKITEANKNLSDEAKKAEDAIVQKKTELIEKVKELIKDASKAREKIKNNPDYNELTKNINSTITKATDENNEESSLSTINENAKELGKLLDEANRIIAKEDLKNTIKEAEEKLQKIKDNNIFTDTTKIEQNINEAKTTLATLDDQNKPTADIQKESAEAIKKLKEEVNKDIKEKVNTKLNDAKTLTEELAKDKYKENDKSPEVKDALDNAIAEIKNLLNDENTSDTALLDKTKELNEAVDAANDFKDKDADTKRKIIDEITNLKTEIENKKQQLSTINDNQIGKGAERYKDLIADIEKKIQDFETNTSDKLNEFNNAKLNEINQDLKSFKETIETKKDAIDNEFKTKFEELDKLKTQANEALKLMPTENEYEPNKKEVQELVTKANEIHNYDSKAELDALIKEFEVKLKSAETKYEAVNNDKKTVIDQINQEIPLVKDFINKYEAEYPDLVADLKKALAEVSDDKAPSINNTKVDLESKLNDLKTKLAQAKENLAKKETQSLNQSLEALKKIKDSLTSNDESMKKLKAETETLINETETIINGSDTEAKKTQKTKVDEFREKARNEISKFKELLDKAKSEHKAQVDEANTLLDSLKNGANKDSYTEIISSLEQAINTNETISDNDPIVEITKKTNDLKSAVEKAKKDQKLADNKALINKLIDELPYPNNGENEAISKRTKERLKTKFASSITESTTEETINQYKKTLEDLKSDLQNATSTINAFDEGDAKNNLLKSLASKDDTNIKDFITNEINKYDEAYKLIEKIEHVEKDSAFGKEKEHIALANNEIDNLKNSLKTKVNKTTQVTDLQNIVDLIKKDTEIVNNLKTTFSGDILIAKNLIEELKAKNDVVAAKQVESKISGIKKELDRFWADNENSGKYIEKNSSLDYPKNGKANLKSFDEFLNTTVRSVKSEQELKDINDKIVPLYIKAIDFAKKAKQIDENIMPKSVKDALANELVKYDDPEKMAKIINYVEKDNSKYLKAYKKLNTIGKDTNRAKLLTELKEVATEPTANDVLKNIDDVSDKIDKFAEKYQATKSALDSYDNNDYKYEKQLGRLKGRLDSAQDSPTLDNLKADIEKANALANSKKALVATLNEIAYSDNAPAKVTLLNAIKDIKDENGIEPIRAKLNQLKEAMKRAKDDLAKLEYPSALNNEKDPKKIISNLLDNTTEVDEINRILPPSWKEDIKKYKEMIKINGLSQDKQNDLNSRLNQTYPTSNEQISKVSELHRQIIETYKDDIQNKIDNYDDQGLISGQKPKIKDEVDKINYENGDTIKDVENKVKKLKAKYVETQELGEEKKSAKDILDSIKYPSEENAPAYKNLLGKLKSAKDWRESRDLRNEFYGIEHNVQEIIIKIAENSWTIDEQKEEEFNNRLDNADTEEKLDKILNDLEKYLKNENS